MGFKYKVFGLVIESEIEINGLNHAEEPADIQLLKGSLPDSLGEGASKKVFYEALDSKFLLIIDRIGKIYVENGNKIVLDLNSNTTIEEVKLYLFGSVIGAIAHQRGLLPLHASAINYAGNAILFAGNSGAGKSTIVAELYKRGYPIIGDDTILINKSNEGEFYTFNGSPEIKLWEDVAKSYDHLGKDRFQILDKEKYRYTLKIDDANQSYNIKRLYSISSIADKDLSINEVKALQKIKIIKNITYRLNIGNLTGNKVHHFKLAAEFAQKMSIKNLVRPRIYNDPALIADLILEDLEKDYGQS